MPDLSSPNDQEGLARLLGREDQPLIAEIVDVAKQHLGMDVSFLTQFQDDGQRLVAVSGDEVAAGFDPDTVTPVEDTYCIRVVRGQSDGIIPDTAVDPVFKDLPTTRERQIGSYIGVPVRTQDGVLYGTLCCVSRESTPGLADRDRNFMQALAQLVASQLDRQRSASLEREAKVARITEVIRSGGPMIAYQPIVDLETGEVKGVEALSRFHEGRPDVWFREAWDVGLGIELELCAIRLALSAIDDLPQGIYMSVNLSPDTLRSDDFLHALELSEPDRVVVEVTEHAAIGEFEQILTSIETLRNRGVRLAVDDLGAGYAGLSQALRLAPEILKLDNFLVLGIESDPSRQALAFATSAFCTMTGATLVAEGVETKQAADALNVLGIRYGQGFFLARPSISPDWPRFLQEPRARIGPGL